MTPGRRLAPRLAAGLVIAAATLAAASWLALLFPAAAFPWSVTWRGLTLYSDEPLDAAEARRVLDGAVTRLSASPLYRSGDAHAIYICNARWRRRLFFVAAPNAGGANYYPFAPSIFLSGARVGENRLIAPSGRVVEAERPLEYFIAHEVAHTLTARASGWIGFSRLDDWAKEGYAEYVARGRGFDLATDLADFLADSPRLNTPSDVPYLRYRFLVAWLLEHERWTLDALFATRLSREDVEAFVRQRAAGVR